jgi:hypothetical protein
MKYRLQSLILAALAHMCMPEVGKPDESVLPRVQRKKIEPDKKEPPKQPPPRSEPRDFGRDGTRNESIYPTKR